MRIILNCIFICSLALNVAQAEQVPAPESNFFPPMKTMPQEKLKPLLEKWDKAIESEIVEEKHKVLLQIGRHVSEENMRFRGSDVLGYDNPEIIDRVVTLYLAECAKPMDMEPGPTNHWYYGEGEYQTLFMTMAESTFDPRIYETVLNPPEYYGELRKLYLATVNPEKTLNFLLESKRGQRVGKQGHPDYFYHGEVSWGMSVDQAYTLLSLMCVQAPQVLISNRDRVMSFVKTHIKHFASPRIVSYKSEPVYLKIHDYDVRNGALDILKLLGAEKDVKLIEEIIRDAPVLDSKQLKGGPRDRREQIQQKGIRVIEQIRQRTKP
ncbi:MAG: hypothetical protein IIB56_10630 [Planctomycetes bacterium]|nr:hypothetical protein [Planctomycetota bacterium]